ncbi:protein FANTASTIC FOUR 3-like [Dendrobium catenatum]|uniref:FAF domain-containing protein n=1 Tax=Dendrobium catenatum TaxID=906689 RepID=A0A2I0WXN6_9ASPA|nr:protein FANTASTIC FOUR 3-like [Dendrobium catenatum]PKU80407.1 hypothetical protein MA16_Dca019899 [Dendrobium catenatum]
MAFCHGLQSFFDPLQANSEAIKLRPACDSSDYPDSVFNGSHGWNSLNFLCSPAKESAFPPPAICTKQTLVKSFNLDMCTETLGCETGAMCSSYDQFEIASAKKKKKNPPPLPTIAVTKQRSAPPPLTTLSGERRLSLGRKQGGGRLTLFPFKPSVLEAERSGGRLQLRFFRREGINKTERGRVVEEEEKDGVEESGSYEHGCGEKHKQAGRCKEEDEGVFDRNSDARWVASS